MTRALLAAAALIAAIAALGLSVLPSASAQPSGPVATGGTHPWKDFYGSTAGTTTSVIYTVPADRVFVVTTFGSPAVGILKESGATKITYTALPEALSNGNAHMTFQPGSLLQVENQGPNPMSWYVEGYLAHP